MGCPASGNGLDAACVFERSGGTWSQTPKLVNPRDSAAGGVGGSIRAYPNGMLFIGALAADFDFEVRLHLTAFADG